MFPAVFFGMQVKVLPGATLVPYETVAAVSRTQGSVREGFFDDGRVRIEARDVVPNVAPRLKVPNHTRTLRAFHVVDVPSGTTHLYVESSRPHQYYEIAGDFEIPDLFPELYWEGNTRLSFVGRQGEGVEERLMIDLALGELSVAPAGDTTLAPRQQIADFD